MHHEDRRAAGQTTHDAEPARVRREQALQLLLSIRLVSREQDVRHALALEVSAVYGGRRLDHVRAPVAEDVKRDRDAPRVQPDERIVVARDHGVGRQGIQGRQHLGEGAGNPPGGELPPAAGESTRLVADVACDQRGSEERHGDAQPRATPQLAGPGRPRERQPGEHGPEEPVGRDWPACENREVHHERHACWPVPPDRFLWAVLPWLALAWAAGAVELWRRPRLRVPVALLAAALVAGYVRYETRGFAGRWWELSARRISRTFAEVLPALDSLPPDAVIASDHDPLVWLYTRRVAVPLYIFSYWGAHVIEPPPPVHRAYLERQGVTHVLLAGNQADGKEELERLLATYPGWLGIVRRWPDGATIFVVHRAR